MQPGYQDGTEPMWWWKVALHLDEAQFALANAMAHNVDDPRHVQALYDRIREGQAVLLEIFRMKGLLPGSMNGRMAAPMPTMPTMPAPPPPDVTGAPTMEAPPQPLTAEEATPIDAEQAVSSELEQPVAAPAPEQASVAALATEPPLVAPPSAHLPDPGAGGVGG